MNTLQLTKTADLMWAQFDLVTLLKKGIWLAIVFVSIFYSVLGSWDSLHSDYNPFETWVYVYLNFLSFVFGVIVAAIIFFRRPGSWMALMTSLMLVTFTATEHGFRVFYQWFVGMPYYEAVRYQYFVAGAYNIALFIDVLYMALLMTTLSYVLLAFPEGQISSRRSRWFFNFLVASQVLLIFVVALICLADITLLSGTEYAGVFTEWTYNFLDKTKAGLLIILAAWPILRLRRVTDPVQRQQIKWIASSLAGMTFFYAVYTFSPIDLPLLNVWVFLILLIFTYAFILTLLMAITRYRLWDMGVFVNRTLVYSSLTATLGLLGYSGATVLDMMLDRFTKSDSPLGGVLALMLLGAVFNPARERMQALVDRHFKPEEMDFSKAVVEIAPESQLQLSSGDILKILVRQSVEQLNVSEAAIYLKWPDGQLVQSEPPARDPMAAELGLGTKMRAQLEKGNLVVPADPSIVSLYVPLVIVRTTRPEFIGMLVLGPRNNGEGYPTPLLESLQRLGCDAGKAIYLAQLRERLNRSGVRQLAGLPVPQRPLNA
jgi:hypothetical protein